MGSPELVMMHQFGFYLSNSGFCSFGDLAKLGKSYMLSR